LAHYELLSQDQQYPLHLKRQEFYLLVCGTGKGSRAFHLAQIRHEVSVNNVIHKLCSNQCFNKYRLANGLIMNCCEQCGEYLPSKSAGNNVLIIEGPQARFCCQGCVNEYKQVILFN
ncbi:hypothetical protein MC885_002911, partial [Smutsia gigantea]